MSHKYLAYKLKGDEFTRGQKLLDYSQREKLKQALLPMNVEVYETIQSFDSDAKTLSSPLYADFDGVGCESIVTELYDTFMNEFNVKATIYYSGMKGFHMILPITITHPKPHLVAKAFFNGFCLTEYDSATGIAKYHPHLDQRVYTERRLWRTNGSVHFKTGLHKKEVPIEIVRDSIELVREYCRVPDLTEKCAMGSRQLDDYVANVIKSVDLEQSQKLVYQSSASNIGKDIPACIVAVIAERPPLGGWNKPITILARFFNSRGYSLSESLEIMFFHEHWIDENKHVEKVFKSIFRNGSSFGCSNEIMLKQHCDVFCEFNKDAI